MRSALRIIDRFLVLRGEFEAAQTFVPLGGETRERFGVEAVGLGCFAERTGKAVGLPGSGAMECHFGHDQRGDEGGLVAAGGLENDEARRELIGESGLEAGDSVFRVGEPPGF
jgi:hypothetical protein